MNPPVIFPPDKLLKNLLRRLLGVRASLLFQALIVVMTASGLAQGPVQKQPLEFGPVRWDHLQAKQATKLQMFSGEYGPGFLRRPGELTPDTWFHDGHLRIYALLNLGDVVRTCELQRGSGPVFMFGNARVPDLLDRLTLTFDGPEFPRAGEEISLRELSSYFNCQGILVVKHGKVVFEEYPGMDPGQRHHWMSVSKSMLNLLMGKLLFEGKLDHSKKVEDYIPELRGTGYGSFTVQEVSDMNADVNLDENNFHDPASTFWGFGRSLGWFNEDGRWNGGVREFVATLRRLEKPSGEAGQRVRYASSSSVVIGWIIEKITGEPLTETIEKSIWRHIGAVGNASLSIDKTGFPFVGAACSSTLRDLARYGMIWANRGLAPDGTRIFAEEWMRENMSGKGPLMRLDYHYRNQSFSNEHAIVHQGHSQQMLWVHPASGTIVACFSSMSTPGGGLPWSALAPLRMAETIERHLREKHIAEAP